MFPLNRTDNSQNIHCRFVDAAVLVVVRLWSKMSILLLGRVAGGAILIVLWSATQRTKSLCPGCIWKHSISKRVKPDRAAS
jgi:hypothetical protein